jgi:hypothetical protein
MQHENLNLGNRVMIHHAAIQIYYFLPPYLCGKVVPYLILFLKLKE